MVEPDKYFRFSDGTIVKNIIELRDKLVIIDDKIYLNHVNESKNDFASWIRDVIGNQKLADELMHQSKEMIIKKLDNVIKKKGKHEIIGDIDINVNEIIAKLNNRIAQIKESKLAATLFEELRKKAGELGQTKNKEQAYILKEEIQDLNKILIDIISNSSIKKNVDIKQHLSNNEIKDFIEKTANIDESIEELKEMGHDMELAYMMMLRLKSKIDEFPGSEQPDVIKASIESMISVLQGFIKKAGTQTINKADELKNKVKPIEIQHVDEVKDCEKLIKNLTEQHQNTKKRISELRKKGGETKFVEILILDILTKIRIFSASKKQKDLDELNASFDEINKELDNIENNIKKENQNNNEEPNHS